MRKRKIKSQDTLAKLETRAKAHFPRKRHELNAPTCLVVDGMNIAYQANFAYKRLSYMGRSTAMIFGVPTIIAGILKSKPDLKKVIVCWDGEKNPKRMRLLPGYKAHREKTRNPKERKRFMKSIERTKRLLYALGIPQAYNPKMEGDDMVYWIVKKYSPLYRIIIASGDKDLHQLINYDVTVYNPISKIPFSSFAYVCDHLVEPHQYIDYLCLVGDTSDDIPGYRGIGPAKASTFFRLFGDIRTYLKSDKDYPGMLDKDKLREIWKRNRMMIDLRRFNEKYHTEKDVTFIKDRRNPEFNADLLESMCLKYGLKTFRTETFQRPFKQLQDA